MVNPIFSAAENPWYYSDSLEIPFLFFLNSQILLSFEFFTCERMRTNPWHRNDDDSFAH